MMSRSVIPLVSLFDSKSLYEFATSGVDVSAGKERLLSSFCTFNKKIESKGCLSTGQSTQHMIAITLTHQWKRATKTFQRMC